ncbi:UNVERIFIED_CONTAM: hypothetical protein FKN15_051967 [Acipenser sinensis]
MIIVMIIIPMKGGTVVSVAASQLQGPGCDSDLRGLSVWSLHVPPVFAVGFLPQSMLARWTGLSKLPLSCPAMDWRPVQGVVLPCTRVCRVRLWLTATLYRIKQLQIMDGGIIAGLEAEVLFFHSKPAQKTQSTMQCDKL